jgi:putative ATPase
VEDSVLDALASLADGDARVALNGLQMAVQSLYSEQQTKSSTVILDKKHVVEGLQRSHLLYDRNGEEHYNCISALHKSIRGSDANAALYWVCILFSL